MKRVLIFLMFLLIVGCGVKSKELPTDEHTPKYIEAFYEEIEENLSVKELGLVRGFMRRVNYEHGTTVSDALKLQKEYLDIKEEKRKEALKAKKIEQLKRANEVIDLMTKGIENKELKNYASVESFNFDSVKDTYCHKCYRYRVYYKVKVKNSFGKNSKYELKINFPNLEKTETLTVNGYNLKGENGIYENTNKLFRTPKLYKPFDEKLKEKHKSVLISYKVFLKKGLYEYEELTSKSLENYFIRVNKRIAGIKEKMGLLEIDKIDPLKFERYLNKNAKLDFYIIEEI